MSANVCKLSLEGIFKFVIRISCSDMSNISSLDGPGLRDLVLSVKKVSLPLYLAASDIRQRYRRSSLGPFWITISTGVMIGCIGLIFGNLFKAPMSEFLPYLTVGLILWTFFSTTITESTEVFVRSESVIRQLPIPLFSHVIRMIAKNLIILAHNALIIPLVYLCLGKSVNWNVFVALPGLCIFVLNLAWISLILGVVCTRFRDMSQIVNSMLQIAFYVTPIIWMPQLLPAKTEVMILDPNPVYHLLELVRAPLLGSFPSLMNWIVSCFLLLFGFLIVVPIFNKYRNKIVYWL
ncbi:ABC transporter permease [Turicimonas muris]|uniref:ABC transporter permease n=1 Tax=Turicimonas muris TaxID=1796652 RepID=UPI002495526C|nr:ABC transporter permease [Turicimonas muris]